MVELQRWSPVYSTDLVERAELSAMRNISTLLSGKLSLLYDTSTPCERACCIVCAAAHIATQVPCSHCLAAEIKRPASLRSAETKAISNPTGSTVCSVRLCRQSGVWAGTSFNKSTSNRSRTR